jgi:tetratricopeptide (TPR) repeat protein
LRSISADIDPAWSGAEVSVSLAFEGDRPSTEGMPLAEGRRLEVFGHLPAARALIEAAQERSPQALVGPQAQLLITLPRPDDGDERWLRRKVKEYGFAAAAGLSLGKLHLWQGRLERADNDFRAVASRAPLDTNAWRWLGLTRLLAGKGNAAQAAIDRLIALGARDSETYYLHALSLYRQRGFGEASEELARVVRAQPHDPAVRNVLACSLVQQWRVDEAMRELDPLAADHREGWRLMAQKCRICAQGYRVYRERMSSDRRFRWRERWRSVATRLGIVSAVLYSLARYLWDRYPWALPIVSVVLIIAIYVFDRWGPQRRAEDQLADAGGQVPNMPCWYASLVWGARRPHLAGRSIVQRMLGRGGEEE